MAITESTTLLELAAAVSSALGAKGIHAVLSGGAAVSIYAKGGYNSDDLDFVTSARKTAIADALKDLGFELAEGGMRLSQFTHPNSIWYVEFPPPPMTIHRKPRRSNRSSWTTAKRFDTYQCSFLLFHPPTLTQRPSWPAHRIITCWRPRSTRKLAERAASTRVCMQAGNSFMCGFERTAASPPRSRITEFQRTGLFHGRVFLGD